MRNATREANVAEPEFEFIGFFKVTFKRNTANISNTSSGTQAVVTADRKREILSIIEKNGKTSSTKIAEKLGLTQGRIRVLLREMVSDGTIEKVGNNRYAYYVLK